VGLQSLDHLDSWWSNRIVVRVVDEDMGEYETDADATKQEREFIRANRKQWLQEDPEKVRAMVAEGAITLLDAIRRYGVILDRKTMELLPRTSRVSMP
jgi:N-methylhydantoinase B